MAHVPRCLVDDLSPGMVPLPEASHRHLLTVLRLQPGAELLLHDGRGGLAHAELVDGGRARVVSREPPAAPGPAVALAVAVPRLPRLEWLVEKAAELEVARLVLLRTRHGERDLSSARGERLQRLADGALLQCGRRHRLEIAGPCTLDEALARRGDAVPWLAVPPRAGARVPDGPAPAAVLACVGPEGGFAPEEEQLLRAAGAQPVALGRTVLRVETAALALAVLAVERLGARV
ncbi:MAG TPA: RsmE family RNA methyltransferase [Planctomycetota bacterium]|nr:RsmE family RNA methyltransferase [Planctomycetota bacterium]